MSSSDTLGCGGCGKMPRSRLDVTGTCIFNATPNLEARAIASRNEQRLKKGITERNESTSNVMLPVKRKRATRFEKHPDDDGHCTAEKEVDHNHRLTNREGNNEAETLAMVHADIEQSEMSQLLPDLTVGTSKEKTVHTSCRGTDVQSRTSWDVRTPSANSCYSPIFFHNKSPPSGTGRCPVRALAAGVGRAKRERRLARNRETARERRRRQKVLIDQLDLKFLTLSRQNHELRKKNEGLRKALESLDASSVAEMHPKSENSDDCESAGPPTDVVLERRKSIQDRKGAAKREGASQIGINTKKVKTHPDGVGLHMSHSNCDAAPRRQSSTCNGSDESSSVTTVAKFLRSTDNLHSETETSKTRTGDTSVTAETKNQQEFCVAVSPSTDDCPRSSYVTLQSFLLELASCSRSVSGIDSLMGDFLAALQKSRQFSQSNVVNSAPQEQQRLALWAKAQAILASCRLRSQDSASLIGLVDYGSIIREPTVSTNLRR